MGRPACTSLSLEHEDAIEITSTYKTLHWGDRKTVSNHHDTLFQFDHTARHSTQHSLHRKAAQHTSSHIIKVHRGAPHTESDAPSVKCRSPQWRAIPWQPSRDGNWRLKRYQSYSCIDRIKLFCFTCLKGVLISDIKYIFVHSTVLLVSEFLSV